jgi:hypothetical protein
MRRTPTVLVGVTLLAAACTAGDDGPPPPVDVAHHLTSPPAGCPNSRPLLQHTPPWGDLFGAAPALGAFYAKPDTSAGSFRVDTNTRRSKHGWIVKVLWVLQPRTTEPVTISGHEMRTGWSIIFDPSNGPPASTMQLDPKHPGTPSKRKGWTESPSSLSFPKSGCYIIDATWHAGSWHHGFGLGM